MQRAPLPDTAAQGALSCSLEHFLGTEGRDGDSRARPLLLAGLWHRPGLPRSQEPSGSVSLPVGGREETAPSSL